MTSVGVDEEESVREEGEEEVEGKEGERGWW